MTKDGLNPIGKMEAKLKHLEFIQGVVNRLAADSFRLPATPSRFTIVHAAACLRLSCAKS